ncbi:hypothetical protein GCM10022243_39610 [Saccharothrix violaceirubra]
MQDVDTAFLRRRDHVGVAVHPDDLVAPARQRGGQRTTTATGFEDARRRRRQQFFQAGKRGGYRDRGKIHPADASPRGFPPTPVYRPSAR